MPPKGWRKTAEGYKPTNSVGAPVTDHQVYGLKDLLLPRATIAQLAKANLPEGTQLPKDGVTALQRAATVFVSYICAEANRSAHTSRHKTVSGPDISQALQQTGFASFVQPSTELAEKLSQRAKDARVQRQQKRDQQGQDDESEYDIEEDPDPDVVASSSVQPTKKRSTGASATNSKNPAEQSNGDASDENHTQDEPMLEH